MSRQAQLIVLPIFLVPLICRAFDVELLYIARHHRMPIAEVPVNWQEIDGQSSVSFGSRPDRFATLAAR